MGELTEGRAVASLDALPRRWRQRRALEAAVWDMLLGAEDARYGDSECAAQWAPAELRRELDAILAGYASMAEAARITAGSAP